MSVRKISFQPNYTIVPVASRQFVPSDQFGFVVVVSKIIVPTGTVVAAGRPPVEYEAEANGNLAFLAELDVPPALYAMKALVADCVP